MSCFESNLANQYTHPLVAPSGNECNPMNNYDDSQGLPPDNNPNQNTHVERKFGEIWGESSKIGKTGLVIAVAICIFPYIGYCLVRKGIPALAKWTFKHIIKPIGNAILTVAQAIFISFPKFVYKNILTPIGHAIKAVANWTYTYILSPIGRAIKAVAKAIFISFPKFVYKNILTPIGHAIKAVANWTYTYILSPIGRAIKAVAKAIFITLPKFVYKNILSPIGQKIAAIFTAIFISFPTYVYEQALQPLAEKIRARRAYTKEHYIDPAKRAISNFFYESIPATFAEIKEKLSTKFA